MGKRSTGRKLAMQVLYQVDIRQNDIQAILDEYIRQSNSGAETRVWAEELAINTWENINAIDEFITKYAIDWDINRLNLVDKSVLRIALYELIYTDTPYTIILNEAIQLVKEFSSEESSIISNSKAELFFNKFIPSW